MILSISSQADIASHIANIENATARAVTAIATLGSPTETFKRMKFERIGFHPIELHPLNIVEQINQTFTYLVALRATAWLLDRHSDAGGFMLAPGAKAALPLDIVSLRTNIVGAETFAAVHPDNNRKLAGDLLKLRDVQYQFRYAFFYAPGFPPGRVERLERYSGVEVHCIGI
jgi:hypothetical protein